MKSHAEQLLDEYLRIFQRILRIVQIREFLQILKQPTNFIILYFLA